MTDPTTEVATTGDRATDGALAEYLGELAEAARQLKEAAHSPNTLRTYRSAWRAFDAWSQQVGHPSLPTTEAALVAYVSHLKLNDAAYPTVVRHVAAIRWMHADTGHDLPTGEALDTIMQGYVRLKGRGAARQAQGLRVHHLQRIIAALDLSRPQDVRDRAILLLGFAAGFRRSELVSLDVDHFSDHDDGLLVTVVRSKADQEGRGTVKAIPYGRHQDTCPVTAYRAWLDVSGITAGPVFRNVRKNGVVGAQRLSDRAVANIVRKRALAVGLNGHWSGHSLRRGFATEGAANGVPRHQIMQDGGWTSSAVDTYITAGAPFGERTGSRLGL